MTSGPRVDGLDPLNPARIFGTISLLTSPHEDSHDRRDD